MLEFIACWGGGGIPSNLALSEMIVNFGEYTVNFGNVMCTVCEYNVYIFGETL